ncbi:MAG: hypothetical protein ACRD2Z_11030 [Thermoanaerobaculia bacterium]
MVRNRTGNSIDRWARIVGAAPIGGLAALALAGGLAVSAPARAQGTCSHTASDAFVACHFEVVEDFWQAKGVCRNESDPGERATCLDEARSERAEARELCREQRAARRALCDALGEAPYDPPFDAADFETDFDDLTNPNPYFPLAVGNSWVYVEGDGEASTIVEVLDKTKLIEGVTCIVVNDVELEEGQVTEDTDDWFAHAIAGDIHYCGEISREFELFDGDDPEEAELVEIEGSWKAGRDGAKAGLLIPFAPQVGDVFRTEWAFGDAEDAAKVLSVDYGFGSDPELDFLVPQQLAELLCNDDCLVTKDIDSLEPEAEERKYYAPGVGLFLEVDLEEDQVGWLVACNVDPVCDSLPVL